MTSKEALEKITYHKSYEKESSCWDFIRKLYNKELALISQDLERLEELGKMLDCLQQDYDNLDLEYIDLLKENQELKSKNESLIELISRQNLSERVLVGKIEEFKKSY